METKDMIGSLYDFSMDGSRDKSLGLFNTTDPKLILERFLEGNPYLTDSDFLHSLADKLEIFFPGGDILDFIRSLYINKVLDTILDDKLPIDSGRLGLFPCEPELTKYIEAFEKKHGIRFRITNPKKTLKLIVKCGCEMVSLVGTLAVRNERDIKIISCILDKCGRSKENVEKLIDIIASADESGYAKPSEITKMIDKLGNQKDKDDVRRRLESIR